MGRTGLSRFTKVLHRRLGWPSIYLVAVIFLLFEMGTVSAFGVTDSVSSVSRVGG